MTARRFEMHSRRFILQRDVDSSGISGVGVVADGIEFPDGTVALRWAGGMQSTVIHDRIENVKAIHGHTGDTRIVFLDQ